MCFIILTVIWLWAIRLRRPSLFLKKKTSVFKCECLLSLGSWKCSSVVRLSSILKGKHYNTHRLLIDLTQVAVNSCWDYRKSNHSSSCFIAKPPAQMWKHFIWMWNSLVTLLYCGQHRGGHVQAGCLLLGLSAAFSFLWQVMALPCVQPALSAWGWFEQVLWRIRDLCAGQEKPDKPTHRPTLTPQRFQEAHGCMDT